MTAYTDSAPHNALSMGRKHSFLQALLYMGLAVLAMAIHAGLSAGLGNIGLLWLIAITIAFLVIKPELALTFLLVTMFLQNIFIASVAPSLPDHDHFNMLMATSFICILLTSLVCVPKWLQMREALPEANRKILRWGFIFFAAVGIYSLLGLLSTPFSSVALYVRVYLGGGLLLAIGVAFGAQIKIDYIISVVRLLTIILVLWGFIEFFWTYDLYSLFNLVEFYHFKYSGDGDAAVYGSVSDVINYSSRSYLNLTGMAGLDLQLLRPNGPNLHPITYAYCTAFCCLLCFMYRSYVLMLSCMVILGLIGAKGPIILVLATLALYMFYASTRRPTWLIVATVFLMSVYAASGIIYGLATDDYHVIGLAGGFKGFMHNPFGHGVGVGGNLSTAGTMLTDKTFAFYQEYGADYGFESAIGVLIYQLGLGALTFFIFYWVLLKNVWKMARDLPVNTRLMILPIILLFLLMNALFQEEAFSPTGWGLWMLFCGFVLSKYWQHGQMEDKTERHAMLPIVG
ncbi:MAG: hypothetical protein M3N08_08685 [Pseudomonadota bacterium]|nr:hypothetical protein [Pseudomonadota bacterium]